jgi:DNA helicase II / ATP-dependent DNA helicase PcrA
MIMTRKNKVCSSSHYPLSRAERYTAQMASPSRFLTSLQRVVPSRRYEGTGTSFAEPITLSPREPAARYEERHLSLYMQCPARYQYEVIEGLYGSRDESPYIQFHRCVYLTVRWLEQERQQGNSVDADRALAQLDAHWAEHGPTDHAFEGFYRTSANAMVTGLATAIAVETAQYDRAEWAVPVGNREVVLTPDRVVLTNDGTVHVQRIRTGRETESEAEKPIYALLRRGAEAHYRGKRIVVETFYLSTGKRVAVAPDRDEDSLEEYAEAIAAIERGNFEPSPSIRICPKCQCYFICRG